MAFPLKLIGAPSQEPLSIAQAKLQLRLDPNFDDDDEFIGDLISAAREEIEDTTGRALWPQQWILATDWFPVYRWWDYAPSRSDYDALGNYNFMGFRWNHSQTISVPRPPFLWVDSLTYIDLNGDRQSIDLATIQTDNISEPGRILPAYGQYWPQVTPQANAVQLTFRAGYGTVSTATVQSTGATMQLGDASFAGLKSVARADGSAMGAWSISPTGLLTLASADQDVPLIASWVEAFVPAWAKQALRLILTAWYENRAEYIAGQSGGTLIPRSANDIMLKHRTELFGYVGRG